MDLTFLRKRHLAGNAWAFEFKPQKPLSWIAGQFIKVDLPHENPDDEGTRRHFTISAAPHEGIVRISTRLTTSTFKQALDRLKPGGKLKLIDMPAGDFVWRDWPKPLTFVAQGIGITPFYAILLDRIHRGLPIPATLLYSNRNPDIPFLDQLKQWAHEHPEFTLALLDKPHTPERLAAQVPDLAATLVYVSGPGSFVKLLMPPTNLPAGQLKQDHFPNYDQASY